MNVFLRLLTALLLCLAFTGVGVLPVSAAVVQAECAMPMEDDASCCTEMACCQMNSGAKDAAPMPVAAPAASADLKFAPVVLKIVTVLPAVENRENFTSRPVADSLTPHAPPPLVRSGIFLI